MQKTLNPVKQQRVSLGVPILPTFPCSITWRGPSSPAKEQHEIGKEQEKKKKKNLHFYWSSQNRLLQETTTIPSEMASLERSQNPHCWCSNIQIIPTLLLPRAWAHSGKRLSNISTCYTGAWLLYFHLIVSIFIAWNLILVLGFLTCLYGPPVQRHNNSKYISKHLEEREESISEFQQKRRLDKSHHIKLCSGKLVSLSTFCTQSSLSASGGTKYNTAPF